MIPSAMSKLSRFAKLAEADEDSPAAGATTAEGETESLVALASEVSHLADVDNELRDRLHILHADANLSKLVLKVCEDEGITSLQVCSKLDDALVDLFLITLRRRAKLSIWQLQHVKMAWFTHQLENTERQNHPLLNTAEICSTAEKQPENHVRQSAGETAQVISTDQAELDATSHPSAAAANRKPFDSGIGTRLITEGKTEKRSQQHVLQHPQQHEQQHDQSNRLRVEAAEGKSETIHHSPPQHHQQYEKRQHEQHDLPERSISTTYREATKDDKPKHWLLSMPRLFWQHPLDLIYPLDHQPLFWKAWISAQQESGLKQAFLQYLEKQLLVWALILAMMPDFTEMVKTYTSNVYTVAAIPDQNIRVFFKAISSVWSVYNVMVTSSIYAFLFLITLVLYSASLELETTSIWTRGILKIVSILPLPMAMICIVCIAFVSRVLVNGEVYDSDRLLTDDETEKISSRQAAAFLMKRCLEQNDERALKNLRLSKDSEEAPSHQAITSSASFAEGRSLLVGRRQEQQVDRE